VEDNHLTGNLNVSLCTNLRNLEVFQVTNNELSGIIPSCFGTSFSEEMIYLTLGGNAFISTIPSSLCRFSKLTDLLLDHNHLIGEIPH
jgi:hypothetical protein